MKQQWIHSNSSRSPFMPPSNRPLALVRSSMPWPIRSATGSLASAFWSPVPGRNFGRNFGFRQPHRFLDPFFGWNTSRSTFSGAIFEKVASWIVASPPERIIISEKNVAIMCQFHPIPQSCCMLMCGMWILLNSCKHFLTAMMASTLWLCQNMSKYSS